MKERNKVTDEVSREPGDDNREGGMGASGAEGSTSVGPEHKNDVRNASAYWTPLGRASFGSREAVAVFVLAMLALSIFV